MFSMQRTVDAMVCTSLQHIHHLAALSGTKLKSETHSSVHLRVIGCDLEDLGDPRD